jgi:hypothetical protein
VSKKLLDRFIASTVGGGSRGALDGYDYDAWKYMDIVERGIALDAVMDKLRRRENDPRAVWLLLRYKISAVVEELIPIAERYVPNETKVWLLKYLWEENVDSKWLDQLGEIAQSWPDPSLRQRAVRILGRTTNPWKPNQIVDMLLPVASDEHEDVRFAVHQALNEMYEGFKEAELVAPSPYSVTARLLLSDLKSVQEEGARLLRWAARRAASGAPVFLGSFVGNERENVDRFVAALKAPTDPEIDHDAARALNGMGRWWAIRELWSSLHNDVRAVRCLQAMWATSSVPFLRELADEGWGECAEAAKTALDELAPLARETSVDAVRAEAATPMSTERAAELGRTLGAADPERLFEAAIDLAVQDDDVRRAFCDAALKAAGTWRDQNRADLELALDVRQHGDPSS